MKVNAGPHLNELFRTNLSKLRDLILIINSTAQGKIGFALSVVFVMLGVLAPLFPYPGAQLSNVAAAYMPPSMKSFPLYALGTDYLGDPISLDVIWGLRLFLEIAVIASTLTVALGVSLGIVAGYLGGVVDSVLNFISNIFLTIPSFALWLVLAIVFIKNLNIFVLGLILGAFSWPGLARAIRSVVLSTREQQYVEAARTLGLGDKEILSSEIMPGLLPYIFMQYILNVNSAVYGTMGLAFIGIFPYSNINWGTILNNALYVYGAVYTVRGSIPVIIISAISSLLLIGFVFLASTSEKIFNPYLRKESAKERVRPNYNGEKDGGLSSPVRPDSQEPGALLQVRNLGIRYRSEGKNAEAIRNVSFSLYRNEILAIAGESGSGKTSIALAVLGLLPGTVETAGTIEFNGREGQGVRNLLVSDKQALAAVRWKKISLVPQGAQNSLNPVISVSGHFIETAKAAGINDRNASMAKARELLTLLKLDPGKVMASYPHQLSGGMKQRVMIALALLLGPDVMILDEPTTALDVLTQKHTIELIEDVKGKLGISIILITHDLSVTAEVADRVMIIHGGRVMETGTVEDVYYSPLSAYTIHLLASLPKLDQEAGKKTISRGQTAAPVPVEGCPFANACAMAIDRCRNTDMCQLRYSTTHLSSCIRAKELENG